jgi:hypothetical protein
MWATLTLLGKSLLGVGSVRSDKPDMDKELVGDFLRNAAMRFGISLSLWSKQDWSDKTTITSLADTQAKRAAEAKPYVQNHPAKGVPSPQVVKDYIDDLNPSAEEIAEVFGFTVVENITPITKPAATGGVVSDKQKGLISKLAKEKADGDITPIISKMFNKQSLNELSSKEASGLIKHLMELR